MAGGIISLVKGSDVSFGVPWAPPLWCGRRWKICIAMGSDVRPAIPLRGRYGTMCIAKGWDVRPSIPWALLILPGRYGTMCIAKGSGVRLGGFLGLHIFYVTGVGECVLSRSQGHSCTPALTQSGTHARTHAHTHLIPFFQSVNHFFPPDSTHSLTVLKHTHKLTYLHTLPPHHFCTSSSLRAFSAVSKSKKVRNVQLSTT